MVLESLRLIFSTHLDYIRIAKPEQEASLVQIPIIGQISNSNPISVLCEEGLCLSIIEKLKKRIDKGLVAPAEIGLIPLKDR